MQNWLIRARVSEGKFEKSGVQMKKILITGGPVHAHLDAVKILTNRFKGGLMADLAGEFFIRDANVHYLYAPELGAKNPRFASELSLHFHDGFYDYQRAVLDLAPRMDAVILGAAVANLIPVKPFEGRFPSHNYKPGDIIPINFTIAPRVIDEVKKVAPKTHLFGFKLLSGVSREELIRAAYDIVLASGATAIFANDEKNLQQVYAVTKERGVHPLQRSELANWIWEMINDQYYRTVFTENETLLATSVDIESKIKKLICKYADNFRKVENGMIFGTVAVRFNSGFLTTGRGKKELDDIVYVSDVNHKTREVFVVGMPKKASLNAPLLARLFENPEVDHIVHYHEQEPALPTLPYAPPGTVRDSERANHTSFNIAEHGCILLFNKEGRQL